MTGQSNMTDYQQCQQKSCEFHEFITVSIVFVVYEEQWKCEYGSQAVSDGCTYAWDKESSEATLRFCVPSITNNSNQSVNVI